MNPAWWVTYVILALYATNSVWLLWLGMGWAALYWFAAALITIAAMNGFTK
jgi:hypothetical protein